MKNRKIQIYGTFGPACKSQEILKNMIQNGMTGMRLNLSHTTLEKSKEYIDNYRLAADTQGIVPQILIDMQGPELRIGDLARHPKLLKAASDEAKLILSEDPLLELSKNHKLKNRMESWLHSADSIQR